VFTGIVEEVGAVVAASASALTVAAREVLGDLRLGDSVAVDGVCLTVTRLGGDQFTVGLQPETLRRTTLGAVRPGRRVNLERALPANGRLGGHFVQGHVDGTATLLARRDDGNAIVLRFQSTPTVSRYVVEKGFVAVDGVSLTVVGVESDTFTLSLVPFTTTHVTLGEKRPGDVVNVEVDILAKYVERFLDVAGRGGVTTAFLAEHGFM
jgi:riboflavin synthase